MVLNLDMLEMFNQDPRIKKDIELLRKVYIYSHTFIFFLCILIFFISYKSF